MELEIPLLVKIGAALLTAGGVVFFKDYERYIGRTWAVILLLFTAFLTLSSLFGTSPREIMCAPIPTLCPPSEADRRMTKLREQIAQQASQIAALKRSPYSSQAQIDAMSQRLSALERERANIGANQPDGNSSFEQRFIGKWGGNR
jgi:hypothetical protein